MWKEQYDAVARELENLKESLKDNVLKNDLELTRQAYKRTLDENAKLNMALAFNEKFQEEAYQLLEKVANHEFAPLNFDVVREFLEEPCPNDLAAFDISLIEELKGDMDSLRSLFYKDGVYVDLVELHGLTALKARVMKTYETYYKITKNGE